MTLTNSNIFSESYTILKSFLNTNITDPRRRFKKQWIHPSEPNTTAQGYDGYPHIILNVDVSEDNKSFDKSTSNKQFSALLTIESDQATEVDSISDEIFSKMKDETLTDSTSEFKSIELAASGFDFRLVGGRKIHRRQIGLIGRTRL